MIKSSAHEAKFLRVGTFFSGVQMGGFEPPTHRVSDGCSNLAELHLQVWGGMDAAAPRRELHFHMS